MKLKHIWKLLVVGIVLSCNPLIAQQAKKSLAEVKGDKFFSIYSFEKAIEKYKKASDLSVGGLRKLAESYASMGRYKAAELRYSQLVVLEDGVIAEDYYQYHYLLKMNGKYDEASKWLSKFRELEPNDLRIKKYNCSTDEIQTLLKDEGRYSISNLQMNTAHQDFGVAYYNNSVLYTSSKEGTRSIKRIYNWNNQPFLDIYVADTVNQEFTNVVSLGGKMNKKLHEGPASYSQGGKIMAFTRNNYNGKSKDGVVKLNIFFRVLENNAWKESSAFYLNNDEYSVGHPCLSHDGNTMYFSSDMPGGFGGVDIYKVEKNDDGKWGAPINLGANINTYHDEMFPFYEETSAKLFFSSNGREGLGGHDIYMSHLNSKEEFDKVYNLGTPINSSRDDFGLIINDELKEGYFCSNREGGKGDDDIYAFQVLKPLSFKKEIKGVVTDGDGMLLAESEVLLLDADNKELERLILDSTAAFSFLVEDNQKFKVVASKINYDDDDKSVNTLGNESVITANLILPEKAQLSLSVQVIDKETGEALSAASVVLLNNFIDEEDSLQTKLKGVVTVTLENSVNDRISYLVNVEKEGYLARSITYNKLIEEEGEMQLIVEMDKIKVGADLTDIIEINPIYFDLGKYNIRKDAALELDKIVQVMNDNPQMVIELGAHTDCRGSAASNERLSNKRAVSSANYIKKRITNPERISGKGYGESQLKNNCACEGDIKSDCSKAEHQENRRTEFIIIKIE